jgi:hypothetical protein
VFALSQSLRVETTQNEISVVSEKGLRFQTCKMEKTGSGVELGSMNRGKTRYSLLLLRWGLD